VDAHHVEHWADGGETKLSNLVTLCRLHHRLVHEGEIRVESLPNGQWRFLHPDGRHFEVIGPSCKTPYDGHELECIHAALGIRIDKDTASTRWRGERMNYDQGVWVLFDRVRHARDPGNREAAAGGPRDVSAGTCANANPQQEDESWPQAG
jgi:hypothetical protein